MNEKEAREIIKKTSLALMKLIDYITNLQTEIINLKMELKIEKRKIVPP